MFFYLNLFRQYPISNVFTSFSKIRPFAHHTFISNNSYRKVINSKRMILSTHYFWCHIPRCARGVLVIFRPQHTCYPKVSRSQISFRIKYKIFRFDISMNYIFRMHYFQCGNHICNKEFGLLLSKASISTNVEPEVTSTEKIHYKV